MAINLHSKYAKQISNKFVRESLTAGRLSNDYSWAGVQTVRITTLTTVPMVDYKRSGTNRYGIPREMEDTVQEMTLSQEKGFALTIDRGNYVDQSELKEAGRALSLQIKERAIPSMDKYVFATLAMKAGNIVGNSTKLTKDNICARITEGTTVMDDAEVPDTGRTLFVPSAVYALLKQSREFLEIDRLGEKAVAKGQVGSYDNMPVVKVPKGRWPLNVNFLIVYKNAATAPVKLNDTSLHKDPPGIGGYLIQGRQYYDCFVFGSKCDGVYVEVDTAAGAGTVLAAPTIDAATGAITVAEGASCKYTTDGSDPRYSKSAKVGTTAVAGEGETIKAYAFKDGVFPSSVAKAEVAVSGARSAA